MVVGQQEQEIRPPRRTGKRARGSGHQERAPGKHALHLYPIWLYVRRGAGDMRTINFRLRMPWRTGSGGEGEARHDIRSSMRKPGNIHRRRAGGRGVSCSIWPAISPAQSSACRGTLRIYPKYMERFGEWRIASRTAQYRSTRELARGPDWSIMPCAVEQWKELRPPLPTCEPVLTKAAVYS